MAFSLEQYNVVWDTPSRNAAGSMPIGNGQIGANVWVEPDGDLLFYLSSTDAWDDNGRLLKLGRVHVSLTPNPFAAGNPFRQTLDLRAGVIEISAGDLQTTITFRVDAMQPAIYVQIASQSMFSVRVNLELWRTGERTLSAQEISYGDGMKRPGGLREYPDTVHQTDKDAIIWYHHNQHSRWPELTGVQKIDAPDPLHNRIFGGRISGNGLQKTDDQSLVSPAPITECLIAVFLQTSQGSLESWLHAIEQPDAASDLEGHKRWWHDFWDRSHVEIGGADPEAAAITQRYLLQRYISACSGRGAFPIKFNGSLFTVEPFMDAEYPESSLKPTEPYNADFRQWGGGYWFQNTRLPYWAMLETGDFEMMLPFFRMYRDALPVATQRTQKYFGHAGGYFPETINAWGLYNPDDYGYERPETLADGDLAGGYIRRYYSGILELLTMALDYFAFTQDRAFVTELLLPFAETFLTFYEQHYPRDENGKLRLYPSQALETWWETVNPTPDLAGLHVTLAGLLALPNDLLSAQQRDQWTALAARIPPIPFTTKADQTVIAPAETILNLKPENAENCELYPVWPFRMYGIGKDNLEIGIATFENRPYTDWIGWQNSSIQAAHLGLTDAAQSEIRLKYGARHPYYRFPVMWGWPSFDWIPDQDNGSVANIALQHMLLQHDDRKIYLFPAWPHEWDVDFKLHAPLSTVIQGRYRGGVLETLSVTPPDREADIVLGVPHTSP